MENKNIYRMCFNRSRILTRVKTSQQQTCGQCECGKSLAAKQSFPFPFLWG